MSPVRRDYVDGPFGQVHLRRAGDPALPLLLLIHQSPSHSGMYEALMAALADRFHCIAPDLPGFGESDPAPSPVTIGDYARVCEAALPETGSATVFGHHGGAAVAVELAVLRPDRVASLVLSGPPLVGEVQRGALLAGVPDLPLDPAGAHLDAMWQRVKGKSKRAPVPLALSQREVVSALRLGDGYGEAYRAILEQPLAERLGALACPLTFLGGSEDILWDATKAAAHQRGQEAVRVAGAATYLCETHVEAVAREIPGAAA